jgi:hypothetical protein
MVHCYDADASSFVDSLGCQNKFSVNNRFDVKENVEHALDFVLHLSHHFWSW